MATKELHGRTVWELLNDTGDQPEKTLDSDQALSGYPLVISGFTDVTPGRRLALAPGADDVAVAFTAAVAIRILSHDYPFSLRLADGETLLANMRQFELFADDSDDAILSGSVLLTGNGDNTADLEIWIVEKP